MTNFGDIQVDALSAIAGALLIDVGSPPAQLALTTTHIVVPFQVVAADDPVGIADVANDRLIIPVDDLIITLNFDLNYDGSNDDIELALFADGVILADSIQRSPPKSGSQVSSLARAFVVKMPPTGAPFNIDLRMAVLSGTGTADVVSGGLSCTGVIDVDHIS